MDVDLSTDITHFPALLESLESGYQVAIGSRLSKGSEVTRGLRREFTSRTYNLLIQAMFFTGFSDAQCGFKAMTRSAAEAIVPKVKNNNWFFDTELLILAEKNGYSILEIPVKWVDDPLSKVNIIKTAIEDIKGLIRLRFRDVARSRAVLTSYK